MVFEVEEPQRDKDNDVWQMNVDDPFGTIQIVYDGDRKFTL